MAILDALLLSHFLNPLLLIMPLHHILGRTVLFLNELLLSFLGSLFFFSSSFGCAFVSNKTPCFGF